MKTKQEIVEYYLRRYFVPQDVLITVPVIASMIVRELDKLNSLPVIQRDIDGYWADHDAYKQWAGL